MGVTNVIQTRNQLGNDYDFSKLFLFENRYRKITIAASGDDLELTQGMLIGTIATSGNGAVMKSGSSDGSQFPVGIMAEDITIADGDSEEVLICIGGHVNESKLVFDGTDDLDTAVSSRTYRDRIASDTLGIFLVTADELSAADNS
jgi:hypothetical protein